MVPKALAAAEVLAAEVHRVAKTDRIPERYPLPKQFS
jgi:hypothetical protein